MTTTEYVAEGMTCQHCVTSVTEEVSRVAGVTAVRVNLDSGRVSVDGDGVDPVAVTAAIEEAGYQAQQA